MGYDQTFDRIRNSKLLILDDLGVENPSAWAQEKLFQLLNHRYSYELPTVITTNVDLDKFDARIRSRILHTEFTHRTKITAPDYRTAVINESNQLLSNLKLYREMRFETFVLDDAMTRKNAIIWNMVWMLLLIMQMSHMAGWYLWELWHRQNPFSRVNRT